MCWLLVTETCPEIALKFSKNLVPKFYFVLLGPLLLVLIISFELIPACDRQTDRYAAYACIMLCQGWACQKHSSKFNIWNKDWHTHYTVHTLLITRYSICLNNLCQNLRLSLTTYVMRGDARFSSPDRRPGFCPKVSHCGTSCAMMWGSPVQTDDRGFVLKWTTVELLVLWCEVLQSRQMTGVLS